SIVSFRQQCMIFPENHALLPKAYELLLGRAVTPFKATLFDKSGKANWLVAWHQDTALPFVKQFEHVGWGPWSEKNGISYAHVPAWVLSKIVALRIHLDASTASNGPLRIIPGSHTLGILTDEDMTRLIISRNRIECVVGRGGVLAMSPLLIHSSSKAHNE